MRGKYHVVCHDCTTECVLDEREAAWTIRTNHRNETAHRISCLQIDVPRASD